MLPTKATEICAAFAMKIDDVIEAAKQRGIRPQFMEFGGDDDDDNHLIEAQFLPEDAATLNAALSEKSSPPSLATLDYLAAQAGMTWEAAADTLIQAGIDPLYRLNDQDVFGPAAVTALAAALSQGTTDAA